MQLWVRSENRLSTLPVFRYDCFRSLILFLSVQYLFTSGGDIAYLHPIEADTHYLPASSGSICPELTVIVLPPGILITAFLPLIFTSCGVMSGVADTVFRIPEPASPVDDESVPVLILPHAFSLCLCFLTAA